MKLSNEQIEELLNKPERESPWGYSLTYKWPEHGAVRPHQKEMRCATVLVNGQKCRVSTYYTLDGQIRCSWCMIKELNQMIADHRSLDK